MGVPETQIAISGSSFVHVNDRSTVLSLSGQTPVISSGGGWTRVGADASVGHFLSPDYRLQVGNTNSLTRKLYGDLYSGNGLYDFPLSRQMAQERITIQGELIEDLDNPRQPVQETHTIWSFQWPPELEGFSLSSIPPDADGVRHLEPRDDASYPSITINSGDRVELGAGNYFIRSITVNSGGALIANTTSRQPIRAAVANLTLNERITETRRLGGTDSTLPSMFLLAMVGIGSVNAVHGFEGVLVSPQADVALWPWRLTASPWSPLRALDGAVFARGVEVHQDGVVRQGFHQALLTNPTTQPATRAPDDEKTRYVDRLGFVDGRSCDHWPVDLVPADYIASLSEHADETTTSVTSSLLYFLKQAMNTDTPVLRTFGSLNELVVTSYAEYSNVTGGLERRNVAVDPDTRRGYDLSYARICRDWGNDPNHTQCTAVSRPVVLNGEVVPVDILMATENAERTDSTDEAYVAVQLVAQTVRFEPLWDSPRLYGRPLEPMRLQFDTNLVIAAQTVLVGQGTETLPLEMPERLQRRGRLTSPHQHDQVSWQLLHQQYRD